MSKSGLMKKYLITRESLLDGSHHARVRAGQGAHVRYMTDEERNALVHQDHVKLFEMGAHPFLTLTLFIAMFERDHGPLEYQIAYGKAMAHLSLPYPDIST